MKFEPVHQSFATCLFGLKDLNGRQVGETCYWPSCSNCMCRNKVRKLVRAALARQRRLREKVCEARGPSE